MYPAQAPASPTLHLSYADFSKLVEEDIRGRAAESRSLWLRQPENLTNWMRELSFVKRSVEASMNFIASERREHPANPANLEGDQKRAVEMGWNEVVEELGSRRTRAMKFLSYVNARIKEAAYLIDIEGVVRYQEADLLMTLHKVENLLVDGEAEGALTVLSSLIDDFTDDPEQMVAV